MAPTDGTHRSSCPLDCPDACSLEIRVENGRVVKLDGEYIKVTVPAGFIGGRHPVGISFLGRMWDDRRLLELAHAYEQATRHRRPPPTVR